MSTRRSKLVGLAVALLTACAVMLAAQPVRAEGQAGLSENFPVDENDPEHGAPTLEQLQRQPLQAGYFLMDIASLGDKALKEKRYADAVKFFKVVARLVPDRAVSFVRLCEAYQGLGDREQAVQHCRTALGLGGVTVADSARYVGLVLGGESRLAPADRADVEAVLAHLVEELADAATVNGLECQFAVKVDDRNRLAACSAKLEELAPNDPRTTLFQWTLAVRRGDAEAARAFLARARAVGVDSLLLAEMTSQTKALGTRWWAERRSWWIFSIALTLAAGAVGLWRARARRVVEKPILGAVVRM